MLRSSVSSCTYFTGLPPAADSCTTSALFFPLLNPEEIPPHQFRKSTENITVERQWRILHDKILANIKEVYFSGRHAAGFLKTRAAHRYANHRLVMRGPSVCLCMLLTFIRVLARWIWAQAVQKRLDEHVQQHNNHRIRLQKTSLPSGVRPVDAYEHPENYGGWRPRTELLNPALTQELVDRYVSKDLFQFGTAAEVAVMEGVYLAIGRPPIHVNNAWAIFAMMVNQVEFMMAGFEFEEFEDEDDENEGEQ